MRNARFDTRSAGICYAPLGFGLGGRESLH